MKLTEGQKTQIEQFASVGFNKEEISIIMELDIDVINTNYLDKGDFYRAYKKGQLQAEYEVRKSIFSLAKMGHADAQKRASQFLTDQKHQDD